MATMLNAGRILYLNKGAWDSSKTYYHLDMVNYNNIVYVCKVTSTTEKPITASGQVSTDWEKFIEQTAVAKATSALAGIVIVDGTTIGVDTNGIISVVGADGALLDYDKTTSKLTSVTVQNAIDEIISFFDTHLSVAVNTKDGMHGIRYYENNLQKYDGSKWVTIPTGHTLVSKQADLDALTETTDSIIEATLFRTNIDKTKLPKSIIHATTNDPLYMTGSTEVKVEFVPKYDWLVDPYVNLKKYYFSTSGKVDIEVWSVGTYKLSVGTGSAKVTRVVSVDCTGTYDASITNNTNVIHVSVPADDDVSKAKLEGIEIVAMSGNKKLSSSFMTDGSCDIVLFDYSGTVTVKAEGLADFVPSQTVVFSNYHEERSIIMRYDWAKIKISTDEDDLKGQNVVVKNSSNETVATLKFPDSGDIEVELVVYKADTYTVTCGEAEEQAVITRALFYITTEVMLALISSLIPTMTSYTTPSGIVSADSEYGHAAYLAVDGNTDTCWISENGTGGWWQYEFDTAKMVRQVAIRSYIKNMMVNTIECSDDGTIWEPLYDGTIYLEADTFKYIDVSPTKKYKIFKVTMCKTIGYRSVINEIQFYGH